MAEKDRVASIADSSQPNAGRIYDFLLGGNHNFEVDRLAAQSILQFAPFLPKLLKAIRWFLGEAVRRVAGAGFTQFIDFASGLPTIDHIHQIAPSGTKVIYSDIDPVTVAYGREILKDNADTRYVVCNAGKPEDLLNAPVVSELFGNSRRVAIGFSGIAWFVSDDQISHAMKALYEWAEKGSCLFLSDSGFEGDSVSPALQGTLDIYAKIGQPMTFRSLNTLKELIRPWKLKDPGFLPLEEWFGMKAEVAEETQKASSTTFQGAILEK
jgi:hypothetical protein